MFPAIGQSANMFVLLSRRSSPAKVCCTQSGSIWRVSWQPLSPCIALGDVDRHRGRKTLLQMMKSSNCIFKRRREGQMDHKGGIIRSCVLCQLMMHRQAGSQTTPVAYAPFQRPLYMTLFIL